MWTDRKILNKICRKWPYCANATTTKKHAHTYTHTHTNIYIYIYVCFCPLLINPTMCIDLSVYIHVLFFSLSLSLSLFFKKNFRGLFLKLSSWDFIFLKIFYACTNACMCICVRESICSVHAWLFVFFFYFGYIT